MKIYVIEIQTDLGLRVIRLGSPMVVDPICDMPQQFCSLIKMLEEKDRQMKIYSMEVQTDLGRRVVQLAAPIDVDPTSDMPPHFRSLTALLWDVLRDVAVQAPALTTPKAEA